MPKNTRDHREREPFLHELGITQAIVDICIEHSRGRRVTGVTVEIGALSGVEAEAVAFCFEACAGGTLVEGARLHVERVPGFGGCGACGGEFDLASLYDPCPRCGAYGAEVRRGNELRVKELEVE